MIPKIEKSVRDLKDNCSFISNEVLQLRGMVSSVDAKMTNYKQM